ncbi:MAG TPA: hypothetical protein VKY40_06840 [Halanaerobiales bacterium]|nr:hypothetical protein [Halanaerobiales bacterium]
MLGLRREENSPKKTGWVVSGLGLLVSTIGSKMIRKRVGAGILGFGLAHILLGQLDRIRPTIRKRTIW